MDTMAPCRFFPNRITEISHPTTLSNAGNIDIGKHRRRKVKKENTREDAMMQANATKQNKTGRRNSISIKPNQHAGTLKITEIESRKHCPTKEQSSECPISHLHHFRNLCRIVWLLLHRNYTNSRPKYSPLPPPGHHQETPIFDPTTLTHVPQQHLRVEPHQRHRRRCNRNWYTQHRAGKVHYPQPGRRCFRGSDLGFSFWIFT